MSVASLSAQEFTEPEKERLVGLGIDYAQLLNTDPDYGADLRKVLEIDRKHRTNKTVGIVLGGVGIGTTAGGLLIMASRNRGNGLSKTVIGGGMTALGAVELGFSMSILSFSKKRKRKGTGCYRNSIGKEIKIGEGESTIYLIDPGMAYNLQQIPQTSLFRTSGKIIVQHSMKKSFCLLVLSMWFAHCDSDIEEQESGLELTATTELISDDFLQTQMQADFETISIDSLPNFGALIKKMQKLSCKGKSVGLVFTQNDTLYKLKGWSECPTDGIISCHFNRNIIMIKNDSLKNLSGDWDKMVHISQLDEEIQSISLKDYHFQYNNDILKPALIHLYIEDRFSISKTKEVLKEITRQFKKINSERGADFFRYNILFEGFSIFDIPPPPPPPELGEE